MASFNSSGIGRREFQGKLEDYGLLRHYGFLSEWADDLTYISHKAPNLLVVGPIGGVDGVYERIGTLSPCDCLGPQRNIQSVSFGLVRLLVRLIIYISIVWCY